MVRRPHPGRWRIFRRRRDDQAPPGRRSYVDLVVLAAPLVPTLTAQLQTAGFDVIAEPAESRLSGVIPELVIRVNESQAEDAYHFMQLWKRGPY